MASQASEIVAAQLTAITAALNVIIDHLDDAGLMGRSEFIERLDANVGRVGADMPVAVRDAMRGIVNLFRPPGEPALKP